MKINQDTFINKRVFNPLLDDVSNDVDKKREDA